jgi:sulfite dehydrogenase (quinone) subunit SoeA
MAIAEAHAADRYPVDTLFLYMSNLAWNSAMNPGDAVRMLTDQDDAGRLSNPLRDLRRDYPHGAADGKSQVEQ